MYNILDEKHLEIIKSLKDLKPKYDGSWLGKSANKALLICFGAGPWKLNRRTKIQRKAINWIGNKDLSDNSLICDDIYPLQWQNDMLHSVMYSFSSLGIMIKYHSKNGVILLNH